MTMDELLPIPHTPDIRKVPPHPEMPGIIPPKPGKLPGEDKPEISDDDDGTIIIPPPAPSPEIRRDRLPGVDHDDDDKDEDPPEPTYN